MERHCWFYKDEHPCSTMDALALTVSQHSLSILGICSPRVVHIFITCLQVDISSWLLEKIICWGCGQRSLWTQCDLARLTRINPELPLVATLWSSGEIQWCSWLVESSYTFTLVPSCPMLTETIGMSSFNPIPPLAVPSAFSWSLQGTVSSAVSVSLPYSLILRTSWQLSVFPPVSSHPQVSLRLRGIKSRSVRFCFSQPPKNIMEGDVRRITFTETLLAWSSCSISWIYLYTCQTWFWTLLNNSEIHIVYTRKHFILYVWEFHQHVCTCSNLGGQKRVAEPPQLELHVVES